jgi:hypothetical protein
MPFFKKPETLMTMSRQDLVTLQPPPTTVNRKKKKKKKRKRQLEQQRPWTRFLHKTFE